MGFSAKAEDEYTQGGPNGSGEDYGLLDDDEYIFEVTGYKDNGVVLDRFDPEGKKTITDVRFYAKPIAYANDPEAALEDSEGRPVHPEKRVQIFFKPEHLGFGPAGPSKNRQFMAAALDRPLRERFDGVEYDDFVGGKFIGVVQRKGKYDNIVGFRPLPKKRGRNKAAEPNLVQQAEKVFNPADDDDLPF